MLLFPARPRSAVVTECPAWRPEGVRSAHRRFRFCRRPARRGAPVRPRAPSGFRSPDRLGVARRRRRLRAPGRPRPRRDVWPVSLQPDAAGRATRGAIAGARQRLSATTALGVQAVSARALFDADRDGALTYFAPVAANAGISPRAGAHRSRSWPSPPSRRPRCVSCPRRAAIWRICSSVSMGSFSRRRRLTVQPFCASPPRRRPKGQPRIRRLPPASSCSTRRSPTRRNARSFTRSIARAPDALVTIPAGDAATLEALRSLAPPTLLDRGEPAGLGRVRRHLFAETAPPPADPLDEVELFSAPGEGREAVEIARRVLREARRGVPFDRMAIALRAPQHYAGLLEHALERAGVPVYFERGTRRPHPAGRAFLALDRVRARPICRRAGSPSTCRSDRCRRRPPPARPARFRRRAMRCLARSASARNSRPRPHRTKKRSTRNGRTRRRAARFARRGSGNACWPSRASWPVRIGGSAA